MAQPHAIPQNHARDLHHVARDVPKSGEMVFNGMLNVKLTYATNRNWSGDIKCPVSDSEKSLVGLPNVAGGVPNRVGGVRNGMTLCRRSKGMLFTPLGLFRTTPVT